MILFVSLDGDPQRASCELQFLKAPALLHNPGQQTQGIRGTCSFKGRKPSRREGGLSAITGTTSPSMLWVTRGGNGGGSACALRSPCGPRRVNNKALLLGGSGRRRSMSKGSVPTGPSATGPVAPASALQAQPEKPQHYTYVARTPAAATYCCYHRRRRTPPPARAPHTPDVSGQRAARAHGVEPPARNRLKPVVAGLGLWNSA